MKAYMFPGQGSQFIGMGGESLFDEFYQMEQKASEILGFSVKDLCLYDEHKVLNETEYLQPALFVVNALSYRKKISETKNKPDFLLGHSLGEFNALEASGAISFEDCLNLVARRGQLMEKISGGGMAAVIGMEIAQIEELLLQSDLQDRLFVANYNSFKQTVLSGNREDILKGQLLFEKNCRYIPLNVSGAFHSVLMEEAAQGFNKYLMDIDIHEFTTPVVSNFSAQFYDLKQLKENLYKQMFNPVRWVQSIEMLKKQGVAQFEQIGPGKVVSNIVNTINQELAEKGETYTNQIEVKKKFNYLISGKNYHVGTKELVVYAAKEDILSFLATAHKSIKEIEDEVNYIKEQLGNNDLPFGLSLTMVDSSDQVKKIMEICEENSIKYLEVSACIDITKEMLTYRLQGLEETNGKIISHNKLFVNTFIPELMLNFLASPSKTIISKLLNTGVITKAQSIMADKIPIVNGLIVDNDEAVDSNITRLMLPILKVKIKELNKKNEENCYLGMSGGIGTPIDVANAFLSGVDFISTSSINLCAPESSLAEKYKKDLLDITITDTIKIPSEPFFEYGVTVSALKKGTLFYLQARNTYNLFKNEGDTQLSDRVNSKVHYKEKIIHDMNRMYGKALRNACNSFNDKSECLIYCSPSLGAFNQYVKGSKLGQLEARKVDKIASFLINEGEKIVYDRQEKKYL